MKKFSRFCRHTYLGKWDKSLLNLSITFALVALLEKGGQKVGLLLQNQSEYSGTITAATVIVILMVIGSLNNSVTGTE